MGLAGTVIYIQYHGKENLPDPDLGNPVFKDLPVCPSGGWTPLVDNCYLSSPTKMNWFQAKKFCERKGGYLAEILSQCEQTNLEALLNTGQYKSYWIGLSDMSN